MPRYRVYLVATASVAVTVEAEDGDLAVEEALNRDLPYVSGYAGYDLSEWTTASEVWPATSKPEDDWEEITDEA